MLGLIHYKRQSSEGVSPLPQSTSKQQNRRTRKQEQELKMSKKTVMFLCFVVLLALSLSHAAPRSQDDPLIRAMINNFLSKRRFLEPVKRNPSCSNPVARCGTVSLSCNSECGNPPSGWLWVCRSGNCISVEDRSG